MPQVAPIDLSLRAPARNESHFGSSRRLLSANPVSYSSGDRSVWICADEFTFLKLLAKESSRRQEYFSASQVRLSLVPLKTTHGRRPNSSCSERHKEFCHR